jgi:hypothetical protein
MKITGPIRHTHRIFMRLSISSSDNSEEMQRIQNCTNRIDNSSSCSLSIHEETTNEIGVYVEDISVSSGRENNVILRARVLNDPYGQT